MGVMTPVHTPTVCDPESPALTWEDLVGVLDALDPVLRADLLNALFDVVLEP